MTDSEIPCFCSYALWAARSWFCSSRPQPITCMWGVHVCAHMHVHMRRSVCGGQRTTSGDTAWMLSPPVSRVSYCWGLTSGLNLLGSKPSHPSVSVSQCWNISMHHHTLHFHTYAGARTWVPRACEQALYPLPSITLAANEMCLLQCPHLY